MPRVAVGVVEGVLVDEDMGVVAGVCVVFNFLSAKLSIFLKIFPSKQYFLLAVTKNIAVINHHLVVVVDVTYLPILNRITDKLYCFTVR